MRATQPLALLLLLAPLGRAQDTPAPPGAPVRVAVRIESRVDGAAEPINGLQYTVWERLVAFGLQADALLPVGNAKYDDYIAKKSAAWASAPPAGLIVEGVAACDYNNSEFFGQGQAHNYKGRLTVTVKDAGGQLLHTFDWEHSWGRLPTNYTKSQVLKEYNDMLCTSLVLGLLHDERVRAGIPEDKRAALKKWEEENRKRILDPLKENMSKCHLARFLRALAGEPDPEEKPPGEGGSEGGQKGAEPKGGGQGEPKGEK